MLPEICTRDLDVTKFDIIEDEDNHDYVYHLDKLATYDGNKMRSKRNLFNRFKRQYQADVQILDSTSPLVREMLFTLFTQWAVNKNRPQEEIENELAAIDKAITTADSGNLLLIGLFVDGVLAGFVLNEILPDEHCVLHFEKADERFEGIYAYLMAENAKILSSFGKKYLNYEQDLGLPGLRLGKKSYRPNHYYKKYIVTPKEDREL